MNKSLKELFKNVETHPQEEFDWGEQEYIARLEKALDKACEELSRLNNDLDRRVITTSTYWKELLLKEVQEDVD